MEREITLSSFAVRDVKGNRPGDFTTKFIPQIELDNRENYYLAFNRIISMAFTWTNINAGNENQKIAFSEDGGTSITDIDFKEGTWNYEEINSYIKEKTKTFDSDGNDVFPINLTFDEPNCGNKHDKTTHVLKNLNN